METSTQQDAYALAEITPTATILSSGYAGNSRQRLIDLGLMLLIAVAPLVISAVYILHDPGSGSDKNVNLHFISGLVHETGALALLAYFLSRQNRSLATIGLAFRLSDIWKGIGLFVLSYGLYLTVFYVTNFSYYWWTREYIHFRDTSRMFSSPAWALFLLYILAAPLFEEAIVRGYLMTELAETGCPWWLAGAASVIIQTAYHLYYGVVGALLLSIGFVVSAIYFARSKRLVPIIIAHLLWDLTAFSRYWHR